MSAPFKAGDKVRCVDASAVFGMVGLVEGRIYKVRYASGDYVDLDEDPGAGYYARRFELVPETQPPFKGGDKVRCVAAAGSSGLVDGRTYEVKAVEGEYVDIDGAGAHYFAHRFELVPAEQPAPTKSPTSAPVTSDLIAKLQQRDAAGKEKYGESLHTFNGRDFFQDLDEELLDALQYAHGARMQYEALEEKLREAERERNQLKKDLAELEEDYDALTRPAPALTKCEGCGQLLHSYAIRCGCSW